jgi:multidrug resistance protein, MATE family
LLSRYAQHRQVEEDVVDSGDETETESTLQRRRRRSSRLSTHSNHHQVQRRISTLGLGIGSLAGDDIERVPAPRPTESTPLLNPAVPRIVENVDSEYTRDYPDGPSHIHEDDDASSIGEPIYNEINTPTFSIFKSELGILTRYALPVYSTHLLEFSIVMSSVLSIGHLSTTALAAITLGSMTANVTALSIIQGFISALDTMLPAAWTSRSPELVGLWSQRMGVVLAVALVPMLTVWWNAEVILLGLRQDPEVARLAGLYLRWLSLGLPGEPFPALFHLNPF